ncbi:hypothetical protein BJF90_13050 [Pseudonocardia sp. CNS-004]|nr:hypothetical protein BJF90_13050 [Pseudonocardia sp. CNS-004]
MIPPVMNEPWIVLTSGPMFPARCTRTAMAGFIVTPTSPIPSMHTNAAAPRWANRANPMRNTRFSTSPQTSTARACRSANRPTIVLPTRVAAP